MKKIKISSIILAIMLLITLLSGCNSRVEDLSLNQKAEESVYPMEIVDGLNNTVTINKLPERIISIAPSQTEILFALGLEDKIVAVSDYCDYPAEALDKEKVGSSWTTNTERIIELAPDIVFVFGEGQAEANEQIAAAGIAIVKFEPESIDDVLLSIETIGKITGTETKAEEVIAAMTTKRDKLLEKVKGQPAKKVFYQVWDEPLMTAGVGSFIDELIRLAGGVNIAADTEGAWPMFSAEALVEKDPEIFILPAHVGGNMALSTTEVEELVASVKARAGYEAISAVKNDRVVTLDPNIVSRPGVRIIEALELFVNAIHPDLK